MTVVSLIKSEKISESVVEGREICSSSINFPFYPHILALVAIPNPISFLKSNYQFTKKKKKSLINIGKYIGKIVVSYAHMKKKNHKIKFQIYKI